ncbi:MAG: barstar family protein [Spirulina sp.]
MASPLSLTHPEIFYVLAEDESDFATRYMTLQADYPNARIVRVRGSKMRSLSALFDEISAAFQFPYYFGENWVALYDCLTDLDWAKAQDYLLLVSDAHLVLGDEPTTMLKKFLDLLVEVHRAWSSTSDQGETTSFRMIFQTSPDSEAIWWEKLYLAGYAHPPT